VAVRGRDMQECLQQITARLTETALHALEEKAAATAAVAAR